MAPKRKAGEAAGGPAKKAAKDSAPADGPTKVAGSKELVIEAWATKLEKLIKDAVPGADVSINPDKPRKGCFEVRAGDKVFVSLLDMPRPFGKLKALDMDKLAEEVIAVLK